MNYIIVTNSIDRTSELVSRSLNASLNQKLPPLKVILIDQREIPLSLPEDITGHSLFERQLVKQKSVSSARNSLRIPGEADWIFFCDDDGFPCNDYSEKLQKIILGNPQLEIIAGSIVREDNNEFYSLRHKKGGNLKYFRNTKNLMGSNFVVKVKTFNDLGRFDENFGAGSYWGSSEETDFCWKAYFAEKNLEFFKELIVYHAPPFNESTKTGFKKAFKYGMGKGALVWKWLGRKRKIKVCYELFEMFTVPFIQIVRGIFTLKFQFALNNIAIISGRIFGLVKAAFIKK